MPPLLLDRSGMPETPPTPSSRLSPLTRVCHSYSYDFRDELTIQPWTGPLRLPTRIGPLRLLPLLLLLPPLPRRPTAVDGNLFWA